MPGVCWLTQRRTCITQQGIPTVVTQGYLVMISVIMAWQLSRFEEVRKGKEMKGKGKAGGAA